MDSSTDRPVASGSGTPSTSIDPESMYPRLSSALLGLDTCLLVCNTGYFQGEPVFAVLLRADFVHLCELPNDAPFYDLPVAPNWVSSASGHPPRSCSGRGSSSSILCPNTYNQWYERLVVNVGEIGSGQNVVTVRDKANSPCGVETVRLVVRKALLQDVSRAFRYVMVQLGIWAIDSSNGMHEFIGSSRWKGMVQILSELLVKNVPTVTNLLTEHFRKFPVKDLAGNNVDVTVFLTAGVKKVRCIVVQDAQPSGRKRPRVSLVAHDMVEEMVLLYAELKQLQEQYDDLQEELPSARHEATVAAVRLQLRVKNFIRLVPRKGLAALEGQHLSALQQFSSLPYPEEHLGQNSFTMLAELAERCSA